MDARRLHVVHMTAEMAPIAKVGGLGDVVTGLARACLLRGHTVEVGRQGGYSPDLKGLAGAHVAAMTASQAHAAVLGLGEPKP